jgi:hypothetical protein
MPKGYPGTGKGAKQPEECPPGFRLHDWVAACTVPLDPGQVREFHRKALSDTKWGKKTTGIVEVNALVEVLDVYCNRCRTQPGREEWCPRHPMRDLPR